MLIGLILMIIVYPSCSESWEMTQISNVTHKNPWHLASITRKMCIISKQCYVKMAELWLYYWNINIIAIQKVKVEYLCLPGFCPYSRCDLPYLNYSSKYMMEEYVWQFLHESQRLHISCHIPQISQEIPKSDKAGYQNHGWNFIMIDDLNDLPILLV